MSAADHPAFGTLLRQFREQAGLTQEQLAERAGLSTDAIGLLERGERQRPQRHTVQRLADALALPDDDRARFSTTARQLPAPPPSPDRAVLPVPPTPIIGRDSAVAALTHLLDAPHSCLVTLTGPGGVGKTRLALEVAARLAPRFTDGAAFVPLAALRDPALVAPAIAQALALREQPGQGIESRLFSALRARHLLIVLDNFEHLLPATPLVADLLTACPRLTLLVTSRTPHHLSAEQQFPLALFAVPDATHLPSPAEWDRSPALALFAQRARAIAPTFTITEANLATVALICHQLDGLPLAIELAAPWVKTLSPRALLTRLERRLPLLTGGAHDLPARQRTLHDAIAWSDALLPRRERALFHRLSVFVGGWTLEALEAICAPDAEEGDTILASLAALVDASLVMPPDDSTDTDREPRYNLLETVREYAADVLTATDEAETIHRQHSAYYLALAERAQASLVGPDEGYWLARLKDEHPNLRSALRRALDRGEAETAVRFAAVLWRFWAERGLLREGRQWLEAILALTSDAASGDHPSVSPLQRAMLLHVTGNLARTQGDYAHAEALYEECLAIRRAHHDTDGIAGVLHNLGIVAYEQGDYTRAVARYEDALSFARQAAYTYGVAFMLVSLGNAACAGGAIERAIELHTEGLGLFRQIGHTWGIARALIGLGDARRAAGDPAHAATAYREGLALSEPIGDQQGIAEELEGLASLATSEGQAAQAVLLFAAATALRERIGAPRPPIQQASFEQSLTVARDALGDDPFMADWQVGTELSIEQIVATAIRPER